MTGKVETGKILLYHALCEDGDFPTVARTNVPPADFEEQVRYLQERFALLSVEEVIEEKSRDGRATAAVTFDDGYADSYRTAYPILRKYGVPATFFLTVSQIGKRWDFPFGQYPGLDWDQIREMDADPLITFGSHGLWHVDFARLSSEEAGKEIKSSKRMLEERLSHPVHYFSYPHGSFTKPLKKRVHEAGYRAAFSVISENRDRYELRRILVSRGDHPYRFRFKLSPLYWRIWRILRGQKRGGGREDG